MSEFVRINGALREMPPLVAAAGPEDRAEWMTNPAVVEARCQSAENARLVAEHDARKAAGLPVPPTPLNQDALVAASAAHAAELAEARARAAIPATPPTPTAGLTPAEE